MQASAELAKETDKLQPQPMNGNTLADTADIADAFDKAKLQLKSKVAPIAGQWVLPERAQTEKQTETPASQLEEVKGYWTINP